MGKSQVEQKRLNGPMCEMLKTALVAKLEKGEVKGEGREYGRNMGVDKA